MGVDTPSPWHAQDSFWMRQALDMAMQAHQQGEVPIGAVLVRENQRVGQGWNQPISSSDPSAHAEIITLRSAAEQINNYRLLDTTLYVTLEPCSMCVGAIVHGRIQRLVFGAFDPKAGAVCSAISLIDESFFNHRVSWQGGLMAEECGSVLTNFFKTKRRG